MPRPEQAQQRHQSKPGSAPDPSHASQRIRLPPTALNRPRPEHFEHFVHNPFKAPLLSHCGQSTLTAEAVSYRPRPRHIGHGVQSSVSGRSAGCDSCSLRLRESASSCSAVSRVRASVSTSIGCDGQSAALSATQPPLAQWRRARVRPISRRAASRAPRPPSPRPCVCV